MHDEDPGAANEDTIGSLQHLWAPDGVYLDTATYGLPPAPVITAVTRALDAWRGGRVRDEVWEQATEDARQLFARLAGYPPDRIATAAATSEFVGLIAFALPAGRLVVAEDDFTSLTYPLAVQRHDDVFAAPLEEIAATIDDSVAAVALSAVQSASGVVAPLADILEAARAHDALAIVDATQALGWLPLQLDGQADAVICSAYKWLMSPRGVAFMAMSDRLKDRLTPLWANWFASPDRMSYYGNVPQLAETARGFDLSPAWFSWVGAVPALELLDRLGVHRVYEHDVRLANEFRRLVGFEPGASAIVSLEVAPGKAEKVTESIAAATRAGRLRLSFHLHNTMADVEHAAAVIAPALVERLQRRAHEAPQRGDRPPDSNAPFPET